MSVFTRSKHLDQGALGLYALGDLPTCHAATVEKHLANCADCRARPAPDGGVGDRPADIDIYHGSAAAVPGMSWWTASCVL